MLSLVLLPTYVRRPGSRLSRIRPTLLMILLRSHERPIAGFMRPASTTTYVSIRIPLTRLVSGPTPFLRVLDWPTSHMNLLRKSTSSSEVTHPQASGNTPFLRIPRWDCLGLPPVTTHLSRQVPTPRFPTLRARQLTNTGCQNMVRSTRHSGET